jgi:hypothetical protein
MEQQNAPCSTAKSPSTKVPAAWNIAYNGAPKVSTGVAPWSSRRSAFYTQNVTRISNTGASPSTAAAQCSCASCAPVDQ